MVKSAHEISLMNKCKRECDAKDNSFESIRVHLNNIDLQMAELATYEDINSILQKFNENRYSQQCCMNKKSKKWWEFWK